MTERLVNDEASAPPTALLRTTMRSGSTTYQLHELIDATMTLIECVSSELLGATTSGPHAIAGAIARGLAIDLEAATAIDIAQHLDHHEGLDLDIAQASDRASELVIIVERLRARSRDLASALPQQEPVTAIAADIDQARAMARELAAKLALARPDASPEAATLRRSLNVSAHLVSIDALLARARTNLDDLTRSLSADSPIVHLSYVADTLTVTLDFNRPTSVGAEHDDNDIVELLTAWFITNTPSPPWPVGPSVRDAQAVIARHRFEIISASAGGC